MRRRIPGVARDLGRDRWTRDDQPLSPAAGAGCLPKEIKTMRWPHISFTAILIAVAFLSPIESWGQSQPEAVWLQADDARIMAQEFSATGRAEIYVGLLPANPDARLSDHADWVTAIAWAYYECLQGLPEGSVRVTVAPDNMPVFAASVTPQGLEALQHSAAVSAILSASRARQRSE